MSEQNPLRPIVQSWIKKITLAQKHKKPFTSDAQEAMDFYCGDPDFMWKDAYARGERGYNRGLSPPEFRPPPEPRAACDPQAVSGHPAGTPGNPASASRAADGARWATRHGA